MARAGAEEGLGVRRSHRSRSQGCGARCFRIGLWTNGRKRSVKAPG